MWQSKQERQSPGLQHQKDIVSVPAIKTLYFPKKMCLNVTFTTHKDHTKSWKASALKLEQNEWIVFGTASHPFIFHMLHPIATTELWQKLLQALCLQTILLKLVGLHAFSWIQIQRKSRHVQT